MRDYVMLLPIGPIIVPDIPPPMDWFFGVGGSILLLAALAVAEGWTPFPASSKKRTGN